MRKSLPPCLLFIFFSFCAWSQERFYHWPSFERSNYSETKFGITVADPYKSLEDVNSDSTKQWLKAQDKLIDYYRRSIFDKYKECEREIEMNSIDVKFDKVKMPHKSYKFFFTLKWENMKDNAPIIMYKSNYYYEYSELCPTAEFKTDDNDKIFIRGIEASQDSKYVGILMSHSGSDWLEIRIRDVEGKKFLSDRIEWAQWGGIVWRKDGFFYSRFDAPDNDNIILAKRKNQSIRYHKLGDDVSKDKVILSVGDNDFSNVTFNHIDSLHQLIVYYNRLEKNKRVTVVAYLDEDSIDKGLHEFIEVPYDGTEPFHCIGTKDGKYIMETTYRALNGRVMLYNPKMLNEATLLIEQFNQPLRDVSFTNGKIFCIYYDKGKYLPVVFDTAGTLLKKLDIPAGFGVSGFHVAINDSITLYSISCFEYFPRIVGFNTNTLKSIIYDPDIGQLFETGYTSKLVFYPSKDSVEIPMYVIYKDKTVPDTSTPVLIYGYGGFDISLGPQYEAGFRLFMEQGGILAVPLIRGGGELGEAWHKAGMLLNKQKSFDDFIAATEYLIKNKYTSPDHIAITGGSNGGLLVAAAMVQRPDLFKVVAPEAAVLDLLNFTRFSSGSQIGIKEYGDPDDSLQYLNLYRLSPLQQLRKDVEYPATIVRVSDHDDRVVPIHGYKFIAALQNDTKSKITPYLMYNIENQGHTREGTLDDIQQQALMYAFIFENLGINVLR